MGVRGARAQGRGCGAGQPRSEVKYDVCSASEMKCEVGFSGSKKDSVASTFRLFVFIMLLGIHLVATVGVTRDLEVPSVLG